MRQSCSTLISSYPQRHWFQGDYSELDPETGLQAFDLRMYSSRIGRWLSVDLYAQYWSPYLAMGNNPISRVDPDGGWADWYVDEAGNEVYFADKHGHIGGGYTWLGETKLNYGNGRYAYVMYIIDENVSLVGDQSAKQPNNFNINLAVNWLNKNAYSSYLNSDGQCGTYIRRALEAGFKLKKDALKGSTTDATGFAKRMGPYLEKLGFQKEEGSDFRAGDIAVIQNYKGGSLAGHVQMYNGRIWISDFKQRDFWPGSVYREKKPALQIYRFIINN